VSLFGFLGNVVKGAASGFLTGGPAGALIGGAGSVIQQATSKPTIQRPLITAGAAPTSVLVNRILTNTQPVVKPAGMLQGPGQTPFPQLPDSTKTSGVSTPFGSIGTTTTYYPTAGGAPPPGGRGYHLNKAAYYTKGGKLVAAGTKWVKNRRRNPLNPRALSRSISRITSAKNAAKFLGRVTVRPRSECR
jgi:hypothetical protein